MPARVLPLMVVALLVGCPEGEPSAPETPDELRASDYVSEALDAELEEISERVRRRGFNPAGEVWRGFLVDRSTDTQRLGLRSGDCVVFVAVASPELRGLELAVHDGDGAEMARSEPDHWGVRYCAATSGVHFVVARAEGDGLFAVQRFEGPPGLAIRFDDLRGPREALQPGRLVGP